MTDYLRGHDPVLDGLFDRWGIPEDERAAMAAPTRETLGYRRAKLTAALTDLGSSLAAAADESFETLRRRVHREDN